MKKLLSALAIATMITTTALACPEWECNLELNDYSCGGVHGCVTSSCSYTETYEYNEYSTTRQAIYCQYCGHEQWDCICGTYQQTTGCIDYDYQDSGCIDYDYDCDYDYGYGYGGSCNNSYSCGGNRMTHWANIRDCYGNIIGQVGEGSSVEVCGYESGTGRVLIYDYNSGCYGSVLAECVYGGYEWDGSGDNGYYNSYQGGSGCVNYDYDCDYDCYDYDAYDCGYGGGYEDCSYNGSYGTSLCAAYSTTTYTQIVQTIVEQVSYSMSSFGFGGCGGYRKGWC